MTSTAVFLATCAYAALVGGDWMALGRFLVPGLPFLAVSFGLRAGAAAGSGAAAVRSGIAAVAAVILLSLPGAFDRPRLPQSVLRRLDFRWNDEAKSEREVWQLVRRNYGENVMLGRALRANTRPGDSIILGAIGAVAYHSDLFIYDRLGLVTPSVTANPRNVGRRQPGHMRIVARQHFLREKPTIFEARIADASTGIDAIAPPGLAVAQWYERVAIPLRIEDGFPAGSSLVMLRRKPDGSGRPERGSGVTSPAAKTALQDRADRG
jgi:hypothetical protein